MKLLVLPLCSLKAYRMTSSHFPLKAFCCCRSTLRNRGLEILPIFTADVVEIRESWQKIWPIVCHSRLSSSLPSFFLDCVGTIFPTARKPFSLLGLVHEVAHQQVMIMAHVLSFLKWNSMTCAPSAIIYAFGLVRGRNGYTSRDVNASSLSTGLKFEAF